MTTEYIMNHYVPELIDVANRSTIKFSVGSILLSNLNPITRPQCNTERSSFHGAINNSLHAEMNVILQFFGRGLQWDKKTHSWCVKGKER